jgi:hypothetical protein
MRNDIDEERLQEVFRENALYRHIRQLILANDPYCEFEPTLGIPPKALQGKSNDGR